MKKRWIIILLTAALLLAACGKVVDASDAQSEQTPAPTETARAEQTPQNAQSVEATPEPTEPVREEPAAPSQEAIDVDDGLSGIGTIRGNTNGNYLNGGHAVSDGTFVYYLDETAEHLLLCRYTLATGENEILLEREEYDCWHQGFLSLYGNDLYFLTAEGEGGTPFNRLLRLSLRDLSLSTLIGDEDLCGLQIAYGILFVQGSHALKLYAPDGTLQSEIADFRLCSTMGGLLYGLKTEKANGIYVNEQYVSLHLDGTPAKAYPDLFSDVYAANGRLITVWLNREDRVEDETTRVTVVDVETDEAEIITLPIAFEELFNVGSDAFYFCALGDQGEGVYRTNPDGTDLKCVDDRLCTYGLTLWNDTLLFGLVPCDAYRAPEPDDTAEVNTVVYRWQGYDCLAPEGFVRAYESDHEFLCATEEMNDRDLFLMAYELRPEADLAGWDSDVFSENHLKTLLGTIGAQADYADFTEFSSRMIADGIVCYHLYNPSQNVYACFAKVASDGKNCLVMAGMTMGEPGVDAFDSIANAFISQHTGA